jgi:hypothetical protein
MPSFFHRNYLLCLHYLKCTITRENGVSYGVYISQLIRYPRACGSYQDFHDRGFLLTRKLLNQRFLLVKLKSSLRKFKGLTRRVPLVEQELPTLPEHLSSPPYLSGVLVPHEHIIHNYHLY